ncbi:hypothetical protein SODG_001901 [Sodalis praecaptivus]|nr:hypothetical protein NVIRENTERO_00394 [Sodalis praecaptivus]
MMFQGTYLISTIINTLHIDNFAYYFLFDSLEDEFSNGYGYTCDAD